LQPATKKAGSRSRHNENGDNAAESDRNGGIRSRIGEIRLTAPFLLRGGRMKKQVIGHDGSTDQCDNGCKRSAWNGGYDQAASEGSDIGPDDHEGCHERQSHECHKRKQYSLYVSIGSLPEEHARRAGNANDEPSEGRRV
jgi:hypothetical protein